MLLWHKEGIEIPEPTFYISICWHLLEAHLEEDLPELLSNFVQRM